MPRPRSDSIDQATTERLLAAAEFHFGHSGFAGARLEAVARDAGISRPSLLYHFPSKEALYEAVIESSFAQLGAALAEAMAVKNSFADQIDASLVGYIAFIERHPAIAQLVLREILGGSDIGVRMIRQYVIPLLDMVESFFQRRGAADLRDPAPVRQAILLVTTSALVRSAAGPLQGPLWGPGDHTMALARALLMRE